MKFTRPLLILVAVAAIAGGLGYALRDKPAPPVVFTTLQGQPVSMESLRGKVVLVNFWATTCPGCVKEMPALIETYRQYKNRGFEVVAVAMSYDPPSYVMKFTQDRQLPFPVALDVSGEHARAFGNVQITPASFLIGKDGAIVERRIGELDFVKLKARLDQELS
jgi:peroxiredoxin